MHIHVLGICGTFMGGIAAIAREAGHRVTGCDANVYPPMSSQLQALGIELIEGFDAKQIELKPDMFVIGNVVSRGNALMEEILNRRLGYTSGPQWLAEQVLHDYWVLAVAGTHGKTTTSAMLAWILDYAGRQPGFLIGGIPQNFGISARLKAISPAGPASTDDPLFVIEADEYDTAFFDKRSKFVHYRARTAILNNLEYDHADIFPDLGAIETQFHHLVRTVPGNGLLVTNGRDANLARILTRGSWTPIERFGLGEGWDGSSLGDDGSFDVTYQGAVLGTLRWELLGEHNRLNALAAIAAARHAGVAPATAIEALAAFQNVKRRMEVRGVVNGITIYDDFAHHPTAIATTLAGLRKKVGGARILAVVEPRSNTMKMGVWKDSLAVSLADAQHVFCYTANLGWDATEALSGLGNKLTASEDLGDLVEAIACGVAAGDHVLVMSNGSFGGIHEKLLARLARTGQ
jgi:UDP-N-acetylmuramate: L-alanyl-gamma-D-glutamyl-meso-diaminopimelate ligase